MPDLTHAFDVLRACLPFSCFEARFMQQALLGLLLLSPLTAAMGVHVVTFNMAFFSDALSHSAFAGVALGLLASLSPRVTMPFFGLLVGVAIMAMHRRSSLSSDTVIGVFFSATVAFGLAIISRDPHLARNVQPFLYGDILTITETEIWSLFFLGLVLFAFLGLGSNRLLVISLHQPMARAHGLAVVFWQYAFAALLSLIVVFAVWAVGVFLVTAMLIVPAAAARNVSRSAGAMFWWALLMSVSSSVGGLVLSAQPWMRTATGPTIVLVAFSWFLLSFLVALRNKDGRP